MNMYPREHYYKYRTRMFQTEKDRINAYQSKIKRNRSSDNNKSYDSLQDYDGSELYEKVYEEPEAFIPYAHKEKNVKPWGFVRDQPTLAQKFLSFYHKWFEDRRA